MKEVTLSNFTYFDKNDIDLESVKKSLTAVSKYDKVQIPMYDTNSCGGLIGVPRYFIDYRAFPDVKIVDKREPGSPLEVNFVGTLRENQEFLIEDFCNRLQKDYTGFLVGMPPGEGKTVIALKMFSILKTTTLVVVPRSTLIKQWKERILEYTDLSENEIGEIEGGKGVWRGRKIVVGLVHSIVLDRYGKDFKDRFGCVIFDEVDRSVPPRTFATVVSLFPAKYRVGLSATLKRTDGLSVVFEKHVGECKLRTVKAKRLKPIVLMHSFKGTSGYVYSGSSKLKRRGVILSRLANNTARTMLVARYASLIYMSDRKCVVMSDRKDQLVNIYKLLKLRFKINSTDIGFFVRSLPYNLDGGAKRRYRHLSKVEIDRVASDCKIILATYSMMAIGTDIPSLAGIVYATPQSQIIQSKGRVERVLEGKKTPVLVDIVDFDYKDCVNWWRARLSQYKREGLTVKRIT